MNGYKINNLPSYATSDKYIVCTWVDDELWFYGAYNTYAQAEEAADLDDDRIIIH